MLKSLWIAAAALSLSTSVLIAQNPISDAARADYERVKNYITASAEKVPEDSYSFKPTPDVRNFGELIAHVADSQARNCGSIADRKASGSAASKTSKADLVAALKESFEICDAAYDSLTDATAGVLVASFRGERPKLAVLYGNTVHVNEMYGVMGVYMRLKNIVPPSTEMRGGGARRN